MKNNFATLLLLLLVLPHLGSSQDSLTNKLQYEVNRVFPPNSNPKEILNEAHTLIDLTRFNKSSWVREYISVEVLTSYKGKIKKDVFKNDSLHQELIDLINRADAGKDISVKIQYIPNNTLTNNDIKEMDFSLKFAPENEAIYPGGSQQLKQYLKDNAIDKIPEGSFKGYDLAVVKFTVNEEGKIMAAHLFGNEYRTAKNEKIDALLLETIRNMPCWKPAEYSNGMKVKQEFVLTVGNMESCVIPLLNIRQY